MASHLLLTDSYGHPCVVLGEAIVTATVDTKVSPKGAPKGTPTTLLTLGDGSSLHVLEAPQDLYDELTEELIAEFSLEEDPDGDPEESEESEDDAEETPEEPPARAARILKLQRD